MIKIKEPKINKIAAWVSIGIELHPGGVWNYTVTEKSKKQNLKFHFSHKQEFKKFLEEKYGILATEKISKQCEQYKEDIFKKKINIKME